MKHSAIHAYANIISVVTSDLKTEEKVEFRTNGVLEKTYITGNTSDKNH